MIWEVHYTRLVESDDFFDAVEQVKNGLDNIEEVISVCTYVEEDSILDI